MPGLWKFCTQVLLNMSPWHGNRDDVSPLYQLEINNYLIFILIGNDESVKKTTHQCDILH